MNIGIDVGGTFTDGVLLKDKQVINYTKVPTRKDLTVSVNEAIASLITGIDPKKIERVVLSTTLITNLLAQGKDEPVGLILMPGPGVNPDTLRITGRKIIVKGAVDYRGRLIEEIDRQEILDAADSLVACGISRLGVACKFGQRYPALEEEAVKYIRQNYPQVQVMASHKIHGLLNWVRRANGTAYHLVVAEEYQLFYEQVKEALHKWEIDCPVHILKADGGTLPLEVSLLHPLEGIFSGPAASALGALAVGGRSITAVVMDIGGTTTDLALLLEGVPLLSERGAVVNGYPIPTRTLAVSSFALGGDSSLVIKDGEVTLGERQGPAFCLGGPCLTVTDVLNFLGLCELGKRDMILAELEALARQTGLSVQDIAEKATGIFLRSLEENLLAIFQRWEEEPAYRIWQVLHKKERPHTLICLGGPSKGIGTLWGRKKGWKVIIPPYASVANALGAALAKTTLRLDFFADTQQRIFSTNIGGLHGSLQAPLHNIHEAREFSQKLFCETITSWGLTDLSTEVIYEEGFNSIRNWHTVGKIYQIGLQTPPGLRCYLTEEG